MTVQFKVKNQDLTQFFEKSAAQGVVTITPTEKESRMFFSHFYVDVRNYKICNVCGRDLPIDSFYKSGDKYTYCDDCIRKIQKESKTEKIPKWEEIVDNLNNKYEEETEIIGKLIVKAVDSGAKKMFIRHFLSGIEIEEEGRIGITDIKQILDILKAIPKNRSISFLYDTDSRFLFVETIDKGTYYGYRVRQTELQEQDEIALQNSTLNVDGWDEIHTFEDGKPKITIDGQSADYDTIIKFKKGELTKVIKDSVDLTFDQDIRFSIDGEKVIFRSGRESDGVTTETVLNKKVINPIKAENFIINNFHPIANHLFTTFNFYCRLAGDGALKYWIKSREGNIELNFCSSSV